MQNTSSKALLFRLNASKLISITALVLLFDSVLVYLSQVLGSVGGYIGLLVFIARIALYIVLFFAFKNENQAELINYDKKNGLLKALQYVSLVFLVIALLSFFITIILDAAVSNEQNPEILRIGTARVYKVKYAIDLVGNVFSNINLIGLFAIKIYLDENKDSRLRNTALASALVIFFHLLVAVAKYLIKYFAIDRIIIDMIENPANTIADYPERSIGIPFFNVFANILVYASYLIILLLFDYRKKVLQKELHEQQNKIPEI